MRKLIALVTVVVLGVTAHAAHAQTSYPTKPVEIVVGFAPGGAADVAGRLIAGYAS
jgi:tripartite-type tricarboxylate transporter receptor subunit TctC